MPRHTHRSDNLHGLTEGVCHVCELVAYVLTRHALQIRPFWNILLLCYTQVFAKAETPCPVINAHLQHTIDHIQNQIGKVIYVIKLHLSIIDNRKFYFRI